MVVGTFGNSDPLKVAEWVELTGADTVPSAATADRDGRQCIDIIDAVHYEFVTMKVGSTTNPQEKIVSAAVSYHTSNWVFRQPLDAQTQQFSVKTTVTFVRLEQAADVFVPILPTLIPELPWDVLYPFVASGTS